MTAHLTTVHLHPEPVGPGVWRLPLPSRTPPPFDHTNTYLVGNSRALGGGRLDPDAGDLALKANLGYRNPRGAIMPGPGRAVRRAYSEAELQELGAAGLELEQTLALLGETTFDVFLNGRAYWRNVPERVWTYTLGGYGSSRSGSHTGRRGCSRGRSRWTRRAR